MVAAIKKAGPKKKRAKKEQADELALRAAIEENRVRGKLGATRRASKVRSYKYKDAKPKQPARKLSLDPTAEGLSGRNHRDWQPWEEAIIFAEPGTALDTLSKHQAACDHKPLMTEKPIASMMDREYRTCPTCQAVLRWWGSYTLTIMAEWQSYRITGYNPEEWGELFTKDKSLWLPIMEEAHAALSDEEVPNE